MDLSGTRDEEVSLEAGNVDGFSGKRWRLKESDSDSRNFGVQQTKTTKLSAFTQIRYEYRTR